MELYLGDLKSIIEKSNNKCTVTDMVNFLSSDWSQCQGYQDIPDRVILAMTTAWDWLSEAYKIINRQRKLYDAKYEGEMVLPVELPRT